MRDPEFFQWAFGSLAELFDRLGLKTHTKKRECMVFLMEKIRTCLLADLYQARMDVEFREKRTGAKVQCDICQRTLAAGLLGSHLET